MPVKQSDFEILLAQYSDRTSAIALLKQYRPYLEKLPSIRRPEQSLITIPLPIVRIRQGLTPASNASAYTPRQLQAATKSSVHSSYLPIATHLPCDLAILMCDPEWKIKMGAEILVFIHRPDEDFSHLLSRWRQTQVYLDRDYEWLMPIGKKHILSEAAENIYPLFIIFDLTPERIKKGLVGAELPHIIHKTYSCAEDEITETFSPQD